MGRKPYRKPISKEKPWRENWIAPCSARDHFQPRRGGKPRYIDRVALCVWCSRHKNMSKRRKEGGARFLRDIAAVVPLCYSHSGGWNSRGPWSSRCRVALGASRHTFYLVALSGRGCRGVFLSRETLPFFYLSLFRNPAGDAEPAADSRAGLSSAVRETYGRARASGLSFVETPS